MRELIASYTKKDFRIDTFCTGGPGGQNQNKNATGIRITHIETGLSAESRTYKSQSQNRKSAFEKLGEKIKQHHQQILRESKINVRSNEVVRTYHRPDNRVKDHASGMIMSYDAVEKDITPMLESRREEIINQLGDKMRNKTLTGNEVDASGDPTKFKGTK